MTKTSPKTTIGTTHTVLSKDGTTISYLTMGGGPAVIVIPGVLSMAADYAALARALAEHFTVHTIERRGRGESGPQGDDYSMVKEREDVLALQNKTGASFLVGHSFGGLVALEVARHNQSLSKIAVYEPGVPIGGSIPTDWMPGYEKKLAEKKYVDAFVEFSLGAGPERARNTPPWLMKLLLPLFISSHQRQHMFELVHENLREHREQARLDTTYTPRSETKEFPKLDHFGIDKKAPREVAKAVSEYFLK